MAGTRRKTADSEPERESLLAKLVLVYSAGRITRHELDLKPGANVVGRNSIVGKPLSDLVSEQHVVVIFRPPSTVTIADSGSVNGSFLDGVPLTRATEARHQSVLMLGDSLWIVSKESDDVGYPVIPGIVGKSIDTRRALREILEAAATDLSVLILGETGSGKERTARAIHDTSARRGGPFIAINCAQFTETLLESKLFGHVSGAFTGATRAQQGVFELADGGTLFLDEIGDAPDSIQKALLRVLEQRRFMRVGDGAERPCNARIVAATNRVLELDVKTGDFRHDLFQRLAQLTVELPALRDRREDILLLVERRSQEYWKGPAPNLTVEAAQALLLYDWPGNVRELFNRVDQTHVKGEARGLKFLSNLLKRAAEPFRPYTDSLDRSVLVPLLEKHGGNTSSVARELRCHRNTVVRSMKKHGLTSQPFKRRIERA
jgi:DNA-binding NtrC family response regulator